jgi:hypothetical protein
MRVLLDTGAPAPIPRRVLVHVRDERRGGPLVRALRRCAWPVRASVVYTHLRLAPQEGAGPGPPGVSGPQAGPDPAAAPRPTLPVVTRGRA